MLIVAIPKSASTSLLNTLGKLHRINSRQIFFSGNEAIQDCKFLHNFHSDIRELTDKEVKIFNKDNTLCKQHIFPTGNNLEKINNLEIVVLLRDPEDVVLAYKRSVISHADSYNFKGQLHPEMNDKEWIEQSQEIGLISDLEYFYNTWKRKGSDPNILVINYDELINNTQKTINSIEQFWGLPTTRKSLNLSKRRYSRRNKYLNQIIGKLGTIKNRFRAQLLTFFK